MDMVSFLVGFILASLLWLFVAAAYSAGKQAARVERKQGEHKEHMDKVQSELRK